MPKLLTQAEYARHAQVNPSTISRWIQNGRIQSEPNGLIDPVKADRLRSATESPLPHHQARKAQIDEQKEEQSATPETAEQAPPSMSSEKIGLELKRATMRERIAKADQEEMEREKKRGNLVDYGEVVFFVDDLLATINSLADRIPDQKTPLIAKQGGNPAGIRAELASVMRELKEDISAEMTRKAALWRKGQVSDVAA